MKKAIIYCFSGTGNTRRVAEMIKEELMPYDIETEIFAVTYAAYKNKTFTDPNAFDIVGLMYPEHAFNAPQLFNKFVKRLPKAEKNQQAFIVKTSGEPFDVNNSSSGAVKRYLKQRGYNFSYERHYLMPYNIMFRYPDGLAKQMYLYSKAMAKVSAKKIAENSSQKLTNTFFSVMMCGLGKVEWFGAWFNGLFYHVDKKTCTKCGLCAKNCPAENISITENGKFKFGAHCVMCCRCTMNCPKNAMRMGIMDSWRVNKPYAFEKLEENAELSGNFVNAKTEGYFKKFKEYYDAADEELNAYGIVPPRVRFEPNTETAAQKGKVKV